jgi:ABC-type phosphate/phosphonate transport system substrate-binding protein
MKQWTGNLVRLAVGSLVKVGPSVLAEGMFPRRNDATRCLGVILVVASAFALPTAAEAAEVPLRFLICQPGGPDLGDEQQHVIDKMYRYIEKKTGLSNGRISGYYTNDREKCLSELAQKPAVVLPSLPIYLEYKEKYGLTPVAQLRLNGKTDDPFYVLVKADSPMASPRDLAGKTVTGTHLGSPSFLLDIVLEGKLTTNEVKVKTERFGLRAIRDVIKGKADAVLLDGTQYRALAGTQFEKQLKLLHPSKPLPTPPVTVSKSAPPGFGAKLGQALVGMTDDPEGQEVVKIFRVEGFEVAAPKVWASLEKQIKSAP